MQTTTTATLLRLASAEWHLISLIAQTYASYTVESIERRSDRPFDLVMRGTYKHHEIPGFQAGHPTAFGGWLPLAAIHALTNWSQPPIALMTDYPLMAEQGDWSAVRDSEDSTVWGIFTCFLQSLVLPPQLDVMAKLQALWGNYQGTVTIEDAARPGYRQPFTLDWEQATSEKPFLTNASLAHFYPTASKLRIGWGNLPKGYKVEWVKIR